MNRGRTEMVAADAAQSKPQPVLVDQSGYSSHTATQRAIEAKATYLRQKAAPINADLLMVGEICVQLAAILLADKHSQPQPLWEERQNLVL